MKAESGIDRMAFADGYRNSSCVIPVRPRANEGHGAHTRITTSQSDSRATRAHPKEEPKMSRKDQKFGGVSRRTLLQAGAGLAGVVVLPSALTMPAFAVGVADKPPIGTWPAGSEGDTVNVAAAVPRSEEHTSEL